MHLLPSYLILSVPDGLDHRKLLRKTTEIMDSCSPGAATCHIHQVLIQLITLLRLKQNFEGIDKVQHNLFSYESSALD